MPLTERAREVSAFVTPDGLYQYKVMPFGMKNAPATFQRMIHSLLRHLEGCEAYIDDVIIYSNTGDDHLRIMRKFFNILAKANLTVNLAKSDFYHATVEYLGHKVGQGFVTPITAKVEAISQFPIPTNKNFSSVVGPLTNLLQKKVKFSWTKDCDESFKKIKCVLMNTPVLSAPNFDKQFKLTVDASDIGIGTALFQESDDGVDRVVCYFSKKLTKSQKNYSTIEKECLALLLALQHFDVYLNVTLHPILVYTDHNPLTFLCKMSNKNQRLTRWSLLLQEYDIIIYHIKGKDNVIADALSRVS